MGLTFRELLFDAAVFLCKTRLTLIADMICQALMCLNVLAIESHTEDEGLTKVIMSVIYSLGIISGFYLATRNFKETILTKNCARLIRLPLLVCLSIIFNTEWYHNKTVDMYRLGFQTTLICCLTAIYGLELFLWKLAARRITELILEEMQEEIPEQISGCIIEDIPTELTHMRPRSHTL